MNPNLTLCEACGQAVPESDCVDFDGQTLCSSCLDAETVCCTHCGSRLWRDDNAGTTEIPLCQPCYDHYYTSCDHCGALIALADAHYEAGDEDREEPLCDACYHRYTISGGIESYYYKPQPIFYGTGPRYFGVELEIDEGGERIRSAQALMALANHGAERIYCKHDGSLDDGFEIVTHPMSLDYHLRQMPWAPLCRAAVEMGYRSHQSGSCGLHIHVSRNAFAQTEADQDAAIARVLYFFEKNWVELLKFSRRTQRQMDRWAARYGYRDQPMEILEHAKKGVHAGRYTCVNLTNPDTVEFRIFRGTLKANTIFAALQLVDRVCDAACFLSDEELKALSWTSFAAGCTQPELVAYLKERRLYVNEPVAAEEEV